MDARPSAVARRSDSSEFTQITVNVYRDGRGGLVYAVLLKTVGGGLHRVRMLRRGLVQSLSREAATDPVAALKAVLDSLG